MIEAGIMPPSGSLSDTAVHRSRCHSHFCPQDAAKFFLKKKHVSELTVRKYSCHKMRQKS